MRRLLLILISMTVLTSCDETLVGSEKVLYARYQSFEGNPIEVRLRELLNTSTDGSTSYLKMALVGEAFGRHPEEFKRISKSLRTEKEREAYHWLRERGAKVFEYYPERRPEDFEKVYKKANWLLST